MTQWPANALMRIAVLVCVVAICLGLATYLLTGTIVAGVLVAIIAGGGVYYQQSEPLRQRARKLATPFPPEWRRLLERRVSFYRKLRGEARDRFESDLRVFLTEQRFVAGGDFEVHDETKVLIAASAAMLKHGLPNWEWPRMRDIVIMPQTFDTSYGHGEGANISGMVQSQGSVLFSQRDVKQGFKKGADGDNVALHELAHVMDLADGYADGIPVGWLSEQSWTKVIADRLKKIQRKKYAHVLRDYAGTNEAEFFAVAVEAFFERPDKLEERDPEVYAMLRDYFRLDPANMEIVKDDRDA